MFRKLVKGIIKGLRLPVTKNIRYDLYTDKIIRKVCRADTNCVDVGSLDGEFLGMFLKESPKGNHVAFEPVPASCERIQLKYGSHTNIKVYCAAASDEVGTATFNYVTSNPSYSGLMKRRYDRPEEQDEQIEVKTLRLDDVLPKDRKIGFVKIDVEGAEMKVLRGAREMMQKDKPTVVFEFGKGGSDIYGTTPDDIYNYFDECGMKIWLLNDWLKGVPALSLAQLTQHFDRNDEYYFIAQ